MKSPEKLKGRRLLLMGSKAFREDRLPDAVVEKLAEGMDRAMTIIVGEAPGANRLFQDYLAAEKYKKVIVGHAKSMRYNVGDWKTVQYGQKVSERERHMIEDCTSAIIIWADRSGVIAGNLELLKRYGKPTFLYEFSNRTGKAKAGWLDPERTYDPFFDWKEKRRREKRERQSYRE
jgi:hypothetical protein